MLANQNFNNVSVLLSNGDGTFPAAQNFATGIRPVSVAVGDFKKDRKPDLVVLNRNCNTFTVLINTSPFAPGPDL
jgi:hypothetical protein